MESVKHLMTLSRRDTMLTAFERRRFTGVNQQDGQVVIQDAESNFAVAPGSLGDQVELGYRQIFALAMRHFFDIPREPMSNDIATRQRVKANKAVVLG